MADPRASAASKARPLSPHIWSYRWPITMVTSITHRITGLINTAGLCLITLWLVATSLGRNVFGVAHGLLASWFGRLILFGFTLSISYHLLNGIRHLCWDAGWGFGLKTARNASIAVLIGAILLTLIIWIAAYWLAGAL